MTTPPNDRLDAERKMQDQLDEMGNRLDPIDPFSLMGIIADHLDIDADEVLASPMFRDILNYSQSAGVSGAVEIIEKMTALENAIADL